MKTHDALLFSKIFAINEHQHKNPQTHKKTFFSLVTDWQFWSFSPTRVSRPGEQN